MDESRKETTKVKSEPKVEIFGEDVSSHGADSHKEKVSEKKICCERGFRHHSSLPWGLAFIVFGLILLLSNFGLLPPIVWSQILHFWPVLIVLIGFDILMGRSEFADIINCLIGLFIFVTILGIVLIHTSPQVLNGLPGSVQNYLYSVNGYLQIK